MSKLQDLKRVRSHNFNVLEKQVNDAMKLLQTDVASVDICECMSLVTKSIKDIEKNISKLEAQSEELASEVGDSDMELIDSILVSDTQIFESSSKVIRQLNIFQSKLNLKVKDKTKPESVNEDLKQSVCDERMQKMMEMQTELLEMMNEQRNKIKLLLNIQNLN